MNYVEDVEENLIENYNPKDWEDKEIQQQILITSTKIHKLKDGTHAKYTFYDSDYKLSNKNEAKYVKEDIYDNSGNLIKSNVREKTK